MDRVPPGRLRALQGGLQQDGQDVPEGGDEDSEENRREGGAVIFSFE